jgi:hypothetical protein
VKVTRYSGGMTTTLTLSGIERLIECELLRASLAHLHIIPLTGAPFVTGVLNATESAGIIPEGATVIMCHELHAS